MNRELGSKELYMRLLRHVRPYWGTFVLTLLSMVILAATEPAMPALVKPLLDGSFVRKDPTTIRIMPLLLVLLFLVRGLSSYGSTVGLNWVATKVVMDLRGRMFAKLISLPNQFYDNNPSGTLISKLVYDVNQVTSAATSVVIVIVRDSLTVVGLLAWMFYLNWKLSLIFFIVVPTVGLVVKIISKRLRRLSRSLQYSMGDMTHVLEEAIGAHRVVKVFGGQEYEMSRFHKAINWVRRYNMKVTTTSAANVPVVQLIAVIALAIIVYMALLESSMDKITVGGFVSFFGAMAMLFSPIKKLTNINEQLQKGLAAAESIFNLVDEESEPDGGSRHLGRARGRLTFDAVAFRYPNADSDALRGIDLDIQPGETVALVGQSGSGKSTLVSLIPRFYRPTAGRILLDGLDLEELALADLRSNLALVSQDVVLFNDTIAANIAYGMLQDTPEEKIIAAAKAAHVMEFVEALPEGLQSVIGENGARLSGGQRQRLAIARALLKDAPLLILDEATSALDNESERQIQEALETVKQGRTTLIIAHRLSTIQNADRIVVMEQGQIREIGAHDALLARNGIYKRLHDMQFAQQTEKPLEQHADAHRR